MAKQLTDYILLLDDVIPQDLTKKILDEYSNVTTWSSYGGNYTGAGSVILISTPAVIGGSEIRNQIQTEIMDRVTEAYKKYYAIHARLD